MNADKVAAAPPAPGNVSVTVEVRLLVTQVMAAAAQVSTSAHSLSKGSTEQAASIEETAASMEEMSSMTKQNAGKELAEMGRLSDSGAALFSDDAFPIQNAEVMRHVGYLPDEDGATIIDPDEEVATAVADVFATFTAAGSAYGVFAAFSGRRFPLRAYGGAWAGQLRWSQLTHARVIGILNNPCYAGAYVFGRHAPAQRGYS